MRTPIVPDYLLAYIFESIEDTVAVPGGLNIADLQAQASENLRTAFNVASLFAPAVVA